MAEIQNRWFNAEVVIRTDKLKHCGGRYVMVKKRPDGKVQVFCRHFITTLTKEEAAKSLILGKVCESQEETQRDFDWYANY